MSATDAQVHNMKDGDTKLVRSDLVPLVVGVTGHVEILNAHERAVNQAVRDVIKWLRDGRLESTDNKDGARVPEEHESLKLVATPILVLSSLVSRADQIVAQAGRDAGCQLLAPLPVPLEFCREASLLWQGTGDSTNVTSKSTTPDRHGQHAHERGEDRFEISADGAKRRDVFDELIEWIGPQATIPVHRPEDLKYSKSELNQIYANDLHNCTLGESLIVPLTRAFTAKPEAER